MDRGEEEKGRDKDAGPESVMEEWHGQGRRGRDDGRKRWKEDD